MKPIKFVLQLLFLFVAVFAADVALSTPDIYSAGTNSFTAMAGLFGSLSISQTDGIGGVVIFDSVIEDWVGGATLYKARIPSTILQMPAGTFLKITDGVAQVVKNALVIAGGTATAIRVNKAHLFNVGDNIFVLMADTSRAISAITTTHPDYDILTIATTLGHTPAAGEIISETRTANITLPTPKYVPNAILKETVDLEHVNIMCSGVVRGSVRLSALPFAVAEANKSELPLIRFV